MHPPSVRRCCTRAGALGREAHCCISVNRLPGATSPWCQQSSECGVYGWTRYDGDKHRRVTVRGKKNMKPNTHRFIITEKPAAVAELAVTKLSQHANNISNKKVEGWSRTITLQRPTGRTITINVAWKGDKMNWWTKGPRGLTLVLDYLHIITEATSKAANDQAGCAASLLLLVAFLRTAHLNDDPALTVRGYRNTNIKTQIVWHLISSNKRWGRGKAW